MRPSPIFSDMRNMRAYQAVNIPPGFRPVPLIREEFSTIAVSQLPPRQGDVATKLRQKGTS